MATHEEFGELKNKYSLPQYLSIRETFIPLMRENLIARNNGRLEVRRYESPEIINLKECDLQDLYAADMVLCLNSSCMEKKTKWGFLRETQAKAEKEAPDKLFGLHKTGLDEYLKVIFPDVNDWVHDKAIGVINGQKYSFRPDYRSEQLNLIIEFDGLLHYTNHANVIGDKDRTALYEQGGYKVVRIPYFIQLTNEVVKQIFGVEVSEPLFPAEYPSMHVAWKNTPYNIFKKCPAGVDRMACELLRFPQQMEVNLKALEEDSKTPKGEQLSGYSLLCNTIEKAKSKIQ